MGDEPGRQSMVFGEVEIRLYRAVSWQGDLAIHLIFSDWGAAGLRSTINDFDRLAG